MANLKATEEEWAKLEEAQRAERLATEYGRVVDDLLFRCVRDLAEVRASKRVTEQRISDAHNMVNRTHWEKRGLVDRLRRAARWIETDHLKRRPRHAKSIGEAAVNEKCEGCLLLIEIRDQLARVEQEAAR